MNSAKMFLLIFSCLLMVSCKSNNKGYDKIGLARCKANQNYKIAFKINTISGYQYGFIYKMDVSFHRDTEINLPQNTSELKQQGIYWEFHKNKVYYKNKLVPIYKNKLAVLFPDGNYFYMNLTKKDIKSIESLSDSVSEISFSNDSELKNVLLNDGFHKLENN